MSKNVINLLNGSSSTSSKLKTHYDSPFWFKVRKQAKEQLEEATRPDGSLIWSKLPSLITVNPKVIKGEKYGYRTGIIHFAPSWASGINTCALASLGCGMGCLNESGHGQRHMMNKGSHFVHIARVIRTLIWFKFRDQFKVKCQREIESLERKADTSNAKAVLRPNGTSDILWEKLFPELFFNNPDLIIYDYTKIHRDVDHIKNYSLVYSVNENTTQKDIDRAFSMNQNVVIVLRLRKGEPKPVTYRGKPCLDGDVHDLRFIEPAGHYVALWAKGTAYKDTTGFVHELEKESV